MPLIVFRTGRAGNQLFQFAAVDAFRKKKEKVVFIGFSHLLAVLPGLKQFGVFLDEAPWHKKHFPRIDAGLKILARLRLIGGVFEVGGGSQFRRTRGLLPLTVFWGGWCQNEQIIDFSRVLEASDKVLHEFDLTVLGRPRTSAGRATCFVHVRRGDFLRYPSPDTPAALPPDWFISQMNRVRTEVGPVHFFVFSDDENFARTVFGNLPDTSVVACDESDAFHAMASCGNGILSPSTFSWWAAKIAHSRSAGLFVAPDFWAGWGVSEWIPYRFVKSSFLSYSSVSSR